MEVYARRSRSPVGARDDWGREDSSFRRRSPGPRRGGRMRSRSPPPNIDRYQPGRRDDHYSGSGASAAPGGRRDDYRRRSPPPPTANIDRYVPGQDPPAPIVNPLPHPLSLDQQVGFTWFAEWWRKDQEVKEERERQKNDGRRPLDRLKGERESKEEREKEREKIQAAYDSYKEKLQVQMAKQFVAQNKDAEWFKERYDPEVRAPLRQRLTEFRRGNFTQWQTDLDAGVFDDFTLEGIYKSESNGEGGLVEREEGEAPAANEVLGVGDLVPCKGADLKDEAALQPALLIKTIAPHVSRDKMEAFCKEHLGEGEGGFKWLSLSDPNPLKKMHRIGWVLLNPESEQPDVPKDRNDEDMDDGEEGEEKMDTAADGVSSRTAEKAVAEVNGKSIVDEQKGNFTCHVGVHVPSSSTRKKALWDLFSAPERVERDLQLAMRLVSKYEQELGEDVNGVSKVEERVEEIRSKGLLVPANNGISEKPPKTDEDAEEGEEEDEGMADEEVDDEDLLAKKKKLDLLVEYLRRVFNFCFFCVFESDSVHELARKCTGGHLRRPRASLTSYAKAAAKASAYGEEFPLKKQHEAEDVETSEGSPVAEKQRFNKHNRGHVQLQRAFNWVKTYEDKLFQILEPESADLKKLGGRPIDEGLEKELEKFCSQEDESKFRCKVPDCSKLFKGKVFWRKHVEKRHAEWHEGIVKELDLVNQYVLDPAHISPSRSDATSNGHFGGNSGMVSGTPRGFNLQTAMQMGPITTGLGSLGQYPMPGAFGIGVDASGAVGPLRRGGGRFNSRNAGPYDRNGRTPRYNNGAGGGGRPIGGPPRFPDAVAAAGPREAVAGRSIRSYEDLDAVDGSANGALDY